MKVLVIGAGAREHALVQGLLADPTITAVVAAPGNAGISQDVPTQPLDVTDSAACAVLALGIHADFVVIGPETALVAGVADAIRAAGIPCFGPSQLAAALEGSKAFAKEVMAAADVPTSLAHICTDLAQCERAFDEFGPPYVVKEDGLAAGKGVVVTRDRSEATAHAFTCLDKPGGAVVVEEFLDGPEVSLFCITDGTTVIPLQPAQDFKRAYDGDVGPNTGGMGAYSPLPWAPKDLVEEVVRRVVQPTVDELRRRGIPFVGVVYAGLALTSRGLRVIEFNARFGDPETQVVLARLKSPLGVLLYAAATGALADLPEPRWHERAAVTVVVAAAGYPGTPRIGDLIGGLAEAAVVPGATVLHAGTAPAPAGGVASAGGRVLSVVGVGPDLAAARGSAYRAVDLITLEGSQHRTDIALAAQLSRIPTPSS